jgi:hypothetical protein
MSAMTPGDADKAVVQVFDAEGSVIVEALASKARLDETTRALQQQVPEGGRLHITTPDGVLDRRLRLLDNAPSLCTMGLPSQADYWRCYIDLYRSSQT